MTKSPSFEQALKAVEETVSRLEEGKLPLNESIKAYKNALELLRRCQEILADTEQEIRVIESSDAAPAKTS